MMRHVALLTGAVAFLAVIDSTASARLGEGYDEHAQSRGAGEPLVTATARGTASITGRVTNPGSNSPVRGAEVIAVGRGGRVTARTDDDGAYRLDRLVEGEWRITASKAGYITWQFGQRRPFHTPPPVSIAKGQQVSADIPLTRGGAISGRVYDASGESVSGVQVRAYRAVMEQGGRRLRAVGVTDVTDDTGNFRVYGLPPGDYYVGASLRVAPVDSIVQTTYAPTYFPGTGDIAEAQRIKIALGTEMNATFALLPVRPSRVSGTVLTSSGTPGDAFLNLVSDASELGVPIGVGGVTQQDGTFTLPDVAPGRYRLIATLRGDGPDEYGAVPITTSGDDVSGVTIVTGQPASLRGTIAADTGVTRELPRSLTVVAVSGRSPGSALGSDDGPAFEIDDLSEPFHLDVTDLPDGWAVKAVIVNDVNALDQPIELSHGQRAEARIVLTDRVTDVSGTIPVSDPANPPAIVIFAEDSAKWSGRSRYVRSVAVDARGHFRVRGLPGGERYLSVAVDYLDEGEHLDSEFLTSMRIAALPFTVADGETRTLELKVVQR